MAEHQSAEERTEPASAKKQSEARRKGKVARSAELNGAAVLVFGLTMVYFGGTAIAAKLADVARSTFANAATIDVNAASAQHFVQEGFLAFAITAVPVLSGLMLVGVIANIAQVGFLWTLEPLVPNFAKLNPLSGIQRVMFSRTMLVELVKGLAKVAILALVAYNATNDVLAEAITLADADAMAIVEFMANAAVAISLKVGLAYFALAGADYAYQKFEYLKQLRMTKQEVKDEAKELEGDPLIKGRIRSIQRQIAYRRMMQDVPKADVVVTNPTHFAVAIKYEVGKMSAPKVVAKGVDLIALRIREVAMEHHVPLVEDKPLAQLLYKTVEIGDQIPEKLFQAVAQVLAYVYRLRDQRKAGVI
jgi:flagellar biosynthetic protein FlhB